MCFSSDCLRFWLPSRGFDPPLSKYRHPSTTRGLKKENKLGKLFDLGDEIEDLNRVVVIFFPPRVDEACEPNGLLSPHTPMTLNIVYRALNIQEFSAVCFQPLHSLYSNFV